MMTQRVGDNGPVSNHPMGPEDLALRGELSANVVGFCRLLRTKGAGVGPSETTDALLALEKIDLGNQGHFFGALKTCLAKNQIEQEIFDTHFDSYWKVWDRAGELSKGLNSQEKQDKNVHHPRVPEQKPAVKSVLAWLKGKQNTDEEEQTAGYSPFEVLAQRDFAGFRADELEEISRLVMLIAKILAKRFNRRYRDSAHRGRLDVRRTLRQNLNRGGELIDLTFRRRRRQRLKLVLLCDVSRSMDLYSSFLIQFVYAFQLAYHRLETFAFSTSLIRITESLATENVEEMLSGLSENVPQWSGGTRIGASMQTFVDEFADNLLDNNTAVIVLSDGWDTGDIEVLRDAMHDIHRRSLAVIWLNPLLGSNDYRPDTQGMRAALPHVDVFASAHNAASLKNLTNILGRVQTRNMPERFESYEHQHPLVINQEQNSVKEAKLQRPSSAENLKELARQMQNKKKTTARTNHVSP